MSTAMLARLASGVDLPRAIALLQSGTAMAIVTAAPVGSFLGGLIGWRATFLITVPIGILALIWQYVTLPKMLPTTVVSVRAMTGLLRDRTFTLGMAATALAFIGQNSLSIYLRPFLEVVTRLEINELSLVLLGLGLGGLAGTFVFGSLVRRHLLATMVGLPSLLAILALLLTAVGFSISATVPILILWGFLATPLPVVWNTWMAKVIPGDLEAGGGLQVALIQLAIAGGATAGGMLFDSVGWRGAFVLAAILLAGSASLAVLARPNP